MPQIDNLGVLNQGWGICGFTSSLYALYAHKPNGKLAQAALVGSRMLAEIKTFLVTLQANGKLDLLRQIEQFTRTFPGYSQFTLKGYIAEINKIALLNQVDTKDAKYSLALPPAAVVAYLRDMCNFGTAKAVQVDKKTTDAIIGVADKNKKGGLYGGLCHWMYERNGVVYSWGQQFKSVSAADKDFVVVHRISPQG